MQQQNNNKAILLRERLIHRYIQALDQGDMEGVASVLEAAVNDPELDRLISEINLAYQEEEQLISTAADATFVRDLLRKHFVSAFVDDTPNKAPLTVGDVAARLKSDSRVPTADSEANQRLLGNAIPLPASLSVNAVKKLAADLGVKASEYFWRVFRDTAITLGMGRSHSQAQWAAAREEQEARHKNRDGRSQIDQASTTDSE